jgi:hypothetical protein
MSMPELPEPSSRHPRPELYDPDLPAWTGFYNPDVVLLPADAGPDAVEAVNSFIDTDSAYSGRLAEPVGTVAGSSIVRVDGMDARVLRDSVRISAQGGNRLPDVRLLHRYRRGTAFYLMMDRWGHVYSMETFQLSPEYLPHRPPWVQPLVARRPVIALLDSGVKPHPWLPPSYPPGSPEAPSGFVIEDWQSASLPAPDLSDPYVKVASGHATFIAGLIRLAAPDAQILSMRVMGGNGAVDENNVVEALTTLKRYVVEEHRQVDVVCMAFGRPRSDGDDNQLLDKIKGLLADLSAAGVRLAASAGNDGNTELVYPAAFGHEAGVESVGALDAAGKRAEFSNYGDSVHHWRLGAGVISIVPDDDFAQWSGTSFSVASYAGDAARAAV